MKLPPYQKVDQTDIRVEVIECLYDKYERILSVSLYHKICIPLRIDLLMKY